MYGAFKVPQCNENAAIMLVKVSGHQEQTQCWSTRSSFEF